MSRSKLQDKKYKQKTSLTRYETEIKIQAKCFEQPGPDVDVSKDCPIPILQIA